VTNRTSVPEQNHEAMRGNDVDDAAHEPIPGERDATTAMARQPGAMGGRFNGEGMPEHEHDPSLTDRIIDERAREGGGDARDRKHRR